MSKLGDRAETVEYMAVHWRLGKAANYPCVDCGRPASEWSYIGGAPDERASKHGGSLFSSDSVYYQPRCRKCHRKFDRLTGESNPAAKLTWEQVREIRTIYTGARGQQSTLAKRYGVHRKTIVDIIDNKIWKEEKP